MPREPVSQKRLSPQEKEQSFFLFFLFFARGGKEENGFGGQTGYFLSLSTSETAGVVF